MKINIPREEHPRPQLIRKEWLNLNGPWSFAMDLSNSGINRKLYQEIIDEQMINVPFCPESKLSGIGFTDFMAAVWYQRKIDIPNNWKDKRIRLHFGAVDYQATVWVNGIKAGVHKGGYTPFTFDITDLLNEKDNIITLCAQDDMRNGKQPRGKQCNLFHSYSCSYTRTTGIWQTVWMEAVDEVCIDNLKYIPLASECAVQVEIETSNPAEIALVEISYNGKKMGSKEILFDGCFCISTIKLDEKHLWSPGHGNLYDITIKINAGGKVTDTIESYFGLRSISWDKKGMKINGKYVFQRLILDQGFYPDGIYTAPTDNDLKKDIELSMNMGFNGARLHEKIFEPRYLYHADKMGYLCWREHADNGLDITSMEGLKHFLPEWIESVKRDFNSPAVIGWCPFNETWNIERKGNSRESGIPQDDDVVRFVYLVTKQMDKTRPVIDTSGNYHVITDVFDVHNYNQDIKEFTETFDAMNNGGEVYVSFPNRQQYNNEPYFVSEYGGIWWAPDKLDAGWGYGGANMRPKSTEDFIMRYKGLTEALLNNPSICAFCYTQLTDIEQEVNGLYYYDRSNKFEAEKIAKINKQPAAIEIE